MAQGMPQTQSVEDIIGSQKNSKTMRNYTKVKRPEISMGMVLEQGILDKRHKYTGIGMSLPMVGATPKIPSAAFNQTKPLGAMIGRTLQASSSLQIAIHHQPSSMLLITQTLLCRRLLPYRPMVSVQWRRCFMDVSLMLLTSHLLLVGCVLLCS